MRLSAQWRRIKKQNVVLAAALGLYVYNITAKKVKASTSSFEGCKVSKSIPDEGEWTAVRTLRGKKMGKWFKTRQKNQPLDRQVQKRTDKRLQSQMAWSAEAWKHESVQERRYVVYCSALNLPRTSLGFISLLIVCFKITNVFIIVIILRKRAHL